MTQFKMIRDPSDAATYCIPLSAQTYNTRLAAGVQQSVAVPASVRIAVISSSDHVFVDDAAVTVPAGAFALGGTQNPGTLDVESLSGTGTLYFIARQDTDVSVAFYS